MPATRDGLGPFYQDVIAVSPLEPWDAASAAYRLEILGRTLPFPVDGARLVPSNNNDVWRLKHGYLRVAWRGDRSRLAREAELLGRLQGFLPVPEVLDGGGDDRLSWSLTAGMPGAAYEHLCVQPAPPRLRDLAREVAALLRALHSWSVPGDLADLLRHPDQDPDPLRHAGSELVLMPPSAVLGLIPLARQLPFVDHGVLDAAAERLAELGDLTTDGAVLLHGDFYLGNVLIQGDHPSALIDLEFARMGPRDLEPPDRAEADDLEVTHPLHTLRRLIDAPLPLVAAGLY